MRKIDADTLKIAFKVDHPKEFEDNFKSWDLIDIRKIIDNVPTIEDDSVIHGKWEYEHDCYGRDYFICSCCKTEKNIKDHRQTKYCPDCGAIMDR